MSKVSYKNHTLSQRVYVMKSVLCASQREKGIVGGVTLRMTYSARDKDASMCIRGKRVGMLT